MRIKLYLFFFLFLISISFPYDFQNLYDQIKNISDEVFYVNSFDGTKLAYRVAEPKEPKYVLIFIHGISLYGKYYYHFLKNLSDDGIKVYFLDLRGHGNSEGRRGDSPNEDTFVKDLQSFYSFVEEQNKDLPIYLGGHSMGAGLLLKFVYYEKIKPKGLILIAGGLPMENFRQNNSLLKIKTTSKILFFTSYIFPHFRIIGWELPEDIDDPLIVKDYSYAFFRAVFPSNIKEIWRNLDIPVLSIVGDRDEFYPSEEVLRVYEKYKDDKRKFIVLKDTNHINVIIKSIPYIKEWILSGG